MYPASGIVSGIDGYRRLKRAFHAFALAIVCLSISVLSANADRLEARDFKMAGDASRARVVLNFSQNPDVRWYLVRGPHRLVIDLPGTNFFFSEDQMGSRGLISDVRYGHANGESSRLVIQADSAFQVEKLDIIKNETSAGYRLVVDLVAASERQFEEALREQITSTASTEEPDGAVGVSGRAAFTVVIDPGHGGIDSGAESKGGTLEKTITLAFSLELKKALEDVGYTVALTRDSDVFMRLDERVKVARQKEADLLISIHADAIGQKDIRGATVYTVSDSASDAKAAATALRENLADRAAGYAIAEENHEVSDILADLTRRETHGFSMHFAKALVGELSDQIHMIKNPHRFAGFRVLRAPDVPSVLVELGYLSNEDDEGQLRDPQWRGQAAGAIIAAIDRFAAAKGVTN